MCGRFTLTLEIPDLQLKLGLGEAFIDWSPSYNIAPSQIVPVVFDPLKKHIVGMKWGLIPFWAKDPKIGNQLINARSETVEQKPSFRDSFVKRRCLILADGFYEWKKGSNSREGKQPYYFHLDENKPFVFAGLYDVWISPEGKEHRTCAILTCRPNTLVGNIHQRMPVILDEVNMWMWLSNSQPHQLRSLLQPFSDNCMDAYPVSKKVSNPVNDSVECIQAVRLPRENILL